jgi:uncharacterized repeat protein (TIGR02543 family)
MKEKMKRTLVALLAFCMLITSVSVSADTSGVTDANYFDLQMVAELNDAGEDGNADILLDTEETNDETSADPEEDSELATEEVGEPTTEEVGVPAAVAEEVGEPAAIAEELDGYAGTATVSVGSTVTLSGKTSAITGNLSQRESWSSGNTSIATVSNGTVTGVAKGEVDITHTYYIASSSSSIKAGGPPNTTYTQATETFKVTVIAVINHYMLSTASSNVVVYVTTGNNEELTELQPGEAFTTESADTYFYVKVLDGYGTGTTFMHDWVENDPDRTDFPSDMDSKTSTYVGIYNTGYSPLRKEDAIEEGCTYMFQYTQKSGSYGNFWTMFQITAEPVSVNVNYVANDDTSAKATDIPDGQSGYYHSNVTEHKNLNIITISNTTPGREGYTFAGWLAPDGKTYQPGDTIKVDDIWTYLTQDSTGKTAALTLKAVWQKDKNLYSISYNGNGYTGGQAVADKNQPYEEGTEVTVLANTWRRKNYEFVSWNTKADGSGVSYAAGSKITLTENTVLYAQWKLKGSVQLQYVMVGGASGSTGLTNDAEDVLPDADNDTIIGSTAQLYKNSEGDYEYKFLGWSTTESEDDILSTDAEFKPSRKENKEFAAQTWYAIFEKRPVLTITGQNQKSVYDGTAQTVNGYTVTGTDGISNITTNANGTTTFEYKNKTYTITNIGVTAASGTNASDTPYVETIDVSDVTITCDRTVVTDDFIVKSVNGSLTITKRNVTITAASETKEYDGKALTNSNYTIAGNDFAQEDTPTITVTGTQTIVGTSTNTVTCTGLSDEIAANYTITTVDGSLTVYDRKAKYEISIAPVSKTTTYNGNEQTSEGLTINEQSVTAGTNSTYAFTYGGVAYTLEGVSISGSGINAGTYTLSLEGTAVIRDAFGNDVSAQFLVTRATSTLTINPKEVTITSASAEKEYDGTPLTKNNVDADITVEGFLVGQGAAITFVSSATQTAAGTAANKFSYTLNDGTLAQNYAITTVFGTLRVTPRNAANLIALTITANSGTFTYDGQVHTVEGFVGEDSQNRVSVQWNGQTYYITGLTASATGTDADTYAVNAIGSPIVTDSEGNVVTDQFNVTVIPGTLKIEKRNITVQAASASKIYDGTSLSDGTATIVDGIFADGEGADFTVTGSRTLVGMSTNSITGITYHTGTKAENYNITYQDGTLTIVSRDADARFEVTIVANSKTVTYDGNAQSVSGFENENSDHRIPVIVGTLTYYVDVNALTASASETNAGTYTTAVNGVAAVYDANENDVTNQFIVNVTPGTLTINKRNVVLTSATETNEYVSTGLTAPTVTVSSDGFAEGEGATYTFPSTSKVTLPNTTVSNEFSYVLNGNTNANNYTISVKYGTLTMTGLADDAKYRLLVEANSGSFVYDGTAHTVGGIKNTTFTVAGEDGKTFTVSGLTAADVTETDYQDGGYAVNITGTASVTDNEGNDVTELFIIETKSGTLNIEKRPVLLTSASAQKTYDGTALTAETVTDSYNEADTTETLGFINGDGAIYQFTGTRTLPGTAENTFTYVLTGTTNEDNYNINTVNGSLVVSDRTDEEKYLIPLQPVSGEMIYNGEEQQISGFTETTFTFDGQTYEVAGITAVSKGTEPGVYESVYSGTPVVTDANGNDVTDQFAFDLTATGTLTIKGIYTLTINYVDTVGRTLADSYVERLVEGTSFEPVVSPTIAGYTPNFASVSAPENGMPKRDISVDVVYTANASLTPDNTTPDETTTSTTITTDETTTPAATAAVTAPAATAGTTAAAATPAAANNALTPAAPVQIADNGEVIDNVTIEEEDVPQGMLAFDEDGNPEIVDIEDEQTALADGAETAAWALINLIAAILTAVICILLLISLLKRKKDEEEEENKEASADDEDEKRKKQRVLVKVLGIVPAVVSVIAFILTENMNNPMRWVDRFTLLMIILLVIEILMACFSSKKEKKKEHNM